MAKKGKGRMINVEDIPVMREVGGFVTVGLAGEILGIKSEAIYYLIRAGKLKGIRLGDKQLIVRRSSVERLVRERAGGES